MKQFNSSQSAFLYVAWNWIKGLATKYHIFRIPGTARRCATGRRMPFCGSTNALGLLIGLALAIFVKDALAASPQSWTTNVVPGVFPSESSALSAVRSKGAEYVYAEELQYTQQSSDTTAYVYRARPRPPETGAWAYTGYGNDSPGVGSEEIANAMTLAAYNAQYPECRFTSFTPTEDWQDQGSFGGIPSNQSRVFDMIASDSSCSRRWTVQQWRNRKVECAQYLGWNGSSCIRDAIATLYSKPLTCSPCDLRDNPISLTTGNKVQKEVDISVAWTNFYRTYNSSFKVTGGIGRQHWTHNFNVRLVIGNGANSVLYPDGSLSVFQNGEGIDGSGARLRYVGGEYTLETGSERYIFNDYGRAYQIEHPDGSVISLYFDSKQRLARAMHSSGRYLDFTYADSNGANESEISTVSDARGILVTYAYDAARRLVGVTYADGTSKHYYYSDPNFPDGLTAIGDESETIYSNYQYDTDGMATLSEHAGGVSRGVFEYVSGDLVRHTGVNGAIEEVQLSSDEPYRKVLSISSSQGVASRSYASYSSDFRRRLVSSTDRLGRTENLYYQELTDPELGSILVTQSTQAAGTPQQRKIESWKSRDTNRTVKTLSEAISVKYLLNSRGQPLGIIKEDLASATTRSSTSRYCEQQDVQALTCPSVGLILVTNGPLPGTQDTVAFSYFSGDSAGCNSQSGLCAYRKGDLWKVTNALGQTTEYLAYDGAGRPLSIKDTNRIVTDYTYHPRGWLTAS
ncbi:DUF6531 domain-containing protein, partial [Xanthomonas arboricola]|uniref:RHS repeat domain-containing protein n=1 Tax=Xanthomonas arboricola TaxID=56448 RepID=UPI001E3FCD94